MYNRAGESSDSERLLAVFEYQRGVTLYSGSRRALRRLKSVAWRVRADIYIQSARNKC